MDGTTAGNGPGPRTMYPVVKNVMLASADQVAIDAVSSKMMGFDPMSIDYIRLAHQDGLGVGDPRDITIVGDVEAAQRELEVSRRQEPRADRRRRPDLVRPAEAFSEAVLPHAAGEWLHPRQRGLSRSLPLAASRPPRLRTLDGTDRLGQLFLRYARMGPQGDAALAGAVGSRLFGSLDSVIRFTRASGAADPVASARGIIGAFMSTSATPKAGLEDAVVTSSSICYLDGDRGVLAYCGYDIHDLAEHSTFEEVCYLLWHRRLPGRAELGDLRSQLAGAAALPEPVTRLIRSLPAGDAFRRRGTGRDGCAADADLGAGALRAPGRAEFSGQQLPEVCPADRAAQRAGGCHRHGSTPAGARSSPIRCSRTPPISSTC